MKIDFHHAATYVIARCAGFEPNEAEIIAYAAQYVDDATQHGVVEFDIDVMYERTSSAHKLVNLHNFRDLENRKVWMPFHFLPGNAGLPRGQAPGGSFIHRLVCVPGDRSHVAQDMLDSTIAEQGAVYGLHRLGITMHVYADTWAHQGFAGKIHPINSVKHLHGRNFPSHDAPILPELGHAEALSAPDEPYLVWSWVNGLDHAKQRDNPKEFLCAADNMCKVMQRYRNVPANGLRPEDRSEVARLLARVDPDAMSRWNAWAKSLHDGNFSFARAEELPRYDERAWKRAALGERHFNGTYHYTPEFLTSNWKHFHDALLRHRFVVLHDILPRYEICVI